VRHAAFEFLERERRSRGDVFDFVFLRDGFELEGRRVSLMNQQGIFRPRGLLCPISITTAPLKPGRPRPYDDSLGTDGVLRYRYRGTDPHHSDNVGLREAMWRKLPLIYFHGIVPGRYVAAWPVFIVGDDPSKLTYSVQVDVADAERLADRSGEAFDSPEVATRRRYHTAIVLRRMHQEAFRERVLRAYGELCAVCKLRRTVLLDAAHIRPDSDGGLPEVWNGIALCKLHHAAFDQSLIGVEPRRLVVEVRRDVLDEEDGPMLRHGLQGINGSRLVLPRAPRNRPKQSELEFRYEVFRRAGEGAA
jgi:putative restriction endonuclease